LSLPNSKARQSTLARRYSELVNGALPADCKFPRRPLVPWLRCRRASSSEFPPFPKLKNCIVPPTPRLNHCIPNRLHHAQTPSGAKAMSVTKVILLDLGVFALAAFGVGLSLRRFSKSRRK
jgi:hypothetical protein